MAEQKFTHTYLCGKTHVWRKNVYKIFLGIFHFYGTAH